MRPVQRWHLRSDWLHILQRTRSLSSEHVFPTGLVQTGPRDWNSRPAVRAMRKFGKHLFTFQNSGSLHFNSIRVMRTRLNALLERGMA